MDENRELVMYMLQELDVMSQEELEEFRGIWLEEIKKQSSEMFARVEKFVNAICDVAIDRVNRRNIKVGVAV